MNSNGKKNRRRGNGGKTSGGKEKKSSEPESPSGGQKRRFELPECLHPRCSKRHYVRDCDLATQQEKNELLEEFRQKRRKKSTKAKVGAVQTEIIDHVDTSRFSASFNGGAVESTVLADQGSDVNILSGELLKSTQISKHDLHVSQLSPPRSFKNANLSAEPLTCSRTAQVDVELRIRHGEKLMLREVKWIISDSPVGHA